MVEKINYSILKKVGDIEIRSYPELIVAMVEGFSDNIAFGLLFNYISGGNKLNENINMTTPVINSQKIEMTSPVLSDKNYFAFIMPSSYDMNSIPIPLDPKIKIKSIPKRKLAVIRFGGYSNSNKIKKYKDKLLFELNSKKIKIIGEVFLMRYNSPFAPPFFRRNEIGVEVD